METFKIPTVQPLAKGTVVKIPTESWNELCTVINSIVEVLNAQTKAVQALELKVSSNELNLSKLAKIVEGIYETLE